MKTFYLHFPDSTQRWAAVQCSFRMLRLTSVPVVLAVLEAALTRESCYTTEPNHFRRLGQKSSYFINANPDVEEVVVPGCQPRLLWYLGRHGARKPTHAPHNA